MVCEHALSSGHGLNDWQNYLYLVRIYDTGSYVSECGDQRIMINLGMVMFYLFI